MTATYDRGRGLVLERVLNAPRELVFEAWTTPEGLAWYFSGLPGEVDPTTVELRPGGYWRQTMIVGEDELYVSGGQYVEIDPPARLVYLWGATDGWPKLDPEAPDDALRVTVELAELEAAQTKMTFTVAIPDHFDDEQVAWWTASGMQEGWAMTIDRLVARFAA